MKPTILILSLIISCTFSQTSYGQSTTDQSSPGSSKVNAEKILEKLEKSPVIAEQSHIGDKPSVEGLELHSPTRAAIVLPVEALQNPTIAENISATVTDPETGVAIEGYDPVSYFTQNAATKGSDQFTAEYNGATYYFSSAANRDLFNQSADKYAPAYGGYCTETLASGSLTPASPLNWTIHGDRLFLTRSPQSTKVFRERRALSVTKADKFWRQVDTALNIPNAGANEIVD